MALVDWAVLRRRAAGRPLVRGVRGRALTLVREAGLEPARPKTPAPKAGVSAIPPLPRRVLTTEPEFRGHYFRLPGLGPTAAIECARSGPLTL